MRGRDPEVWRTALRQRVKRTARRVFLATASKGPVRSLLRRRARRAWRSGKPIVFVCTGNICRSPFAERLARRAIPGQAVFSAGLNSVVGVPSPPSAIRAAADQKIDLSEHRARELGAALVRDSGVLFVFDGGNLWQMARRFPWALRKTHPIGALAGSGPLLIDDPFGGPDEGYGVVYAAISAALEPRACTVQSRDPGVDSRPGE
jgi:protein-tyrosine phosphatase